MSSFWERVDEELNYRGMTRKALASEAGFSLCNIGKGIQLKSCPSAETAVKIAGILNVSVEYLVTGDKNYSKKNISNQNEQKVNRSVIEKNLSKLSSSQLQLVADLVLALTDK